MTATEIKEQNKVADVHISSLMENSMVRNTPSPFTKRWKWSSACRCRLCCDSRWYWWASGNHYDRWEWCWHHYWLDQVAYTVQEFKLQQMFSQKEPIKISKDDFGNDLALSRDVVNQKEKTSVSGQKTWRWQWQPRWQASIKSQSIS